MQIANEISQVCAGTMNIDMLSSIPKFRFMDPKCRFLSTLGIRYVFHVYSRDIPVPAHVNEKSPVCLA